MPVGKRTRGGKKKQDKLEKEEKTVNLAVKIVDGYRHCVNRVKEIVARYKEKTADENNNTDQASSSAQPTTDQASPSVQPTTDQASSSAQPSTLEPPTPITLYPEFVTYRQLIINITQTEKKTINWLLKNHFLAGNNEICNSCQKEGKHNVLGFISKKKTAKIGRRVVSICSVRARIIIGYRHSMEPFLMANIARFHAVRYWNWCTILHGRHQ